MSSPFLNQYTKSPEILDLCNSYLSNSQYYEKLDIGCIQGVYRTPKIGCFLHIYEIKHFCCFITQLVKKLHQWSLNEVIKDILPFVLNTKRPLSDIWLLRYKQNSFGCFKKKSELQFFSKNTQNCFAYNSATKYCSEAVLYSKQTAGYPLSLYIKSIALAE